MKKSHQMDMLQGPLLKNIILFALPIALSSILQQLFNAADTAVAGRFGSPDALAAVGTNGEIVALIVGLSAGLAVGANVRIAHFIGAGEQKKIPDVVHTGMLFSVLYGVLFGALGQLISKPLLMLIHTPADILTSADNYLRIYFAGVPFLMIYSFGAAILRAKGDSKRPLGALIFSGVINVFLNLFFVVVCKLSVVGVALATDLSAAVSAAMVAAAGARGVPPVPAKAEAQQAALAGNFAHRNSGGNSERRLLHCQYFCTVRYQHIRQRCSCRCGSFHEL